jgi:uncharacterized membrane protein
MNTADLNTNINPDAEVSAIPPTTGTSSINVGTTERIVSALGGAALTVMALRDIKSPGGISMLLTGGFLLVRGLSGYCAVNNAIGRNTARTAGSPVDINTSVSLEKPASEVYSFWRKLDNLPRFMRHLEKVEEIDETHSRWTAKGPAGVGTLSWEAEIVEDHQNEFISWRSLPGSTVDNAGQVRFRETPTGTEIKVQMSYRLPAGDVGGVAAKLFSPMAEKMMRDDIRDLKKVMETGETPKAGGNSSKRKNRQSQVTGTL